MERRRYFESGFGLTTIGGFIAGLPVIIAIPGPKIAATALTGSGVVVGILGISLVALPFLPRWEEDDPTVMRVTRNNLKNAYSFCNGVFGADFSSFNSAKKWFYHNKKMFFIVVKTKHKGPASYQVVTGFFSIFPLTDEGLNMLLGGQVEPTSFSLTHIAPDFTAPAAYYVGAIASKGGKSKGVALGALIERVRQFIEAVPVRVYTRPTTKDGLRAARQQGFEAVDGSGTKDMNKLYVREP